MEKKRTLWQRFYHEFEHFTDHIIPYLVIIIALALILENPFWTVFPLSHYEPWPEVFDWVVVFFFIVDLVFKWFKTRNVRKFFRLYWLDIVAVFPFYLAFRAYEEVAVIFRAGEEISATGQKVAHEAVLLREVRLIKEAEELAKEARVAREAAAAERAIKGSQRVLRMFKGRLYASHRALVAIHNEHAKEHKEGY